MKYKKRAKDYAEDDQWYFKIENDGSSKQQVSEHNKMFKEWVAAGNTPDEPD
tara:strand:+ start:345 stop:500 length:156 start_codon:yes stop_codon:yes gene_type:complete